VVGAPESNPREINCQDCQKVADTSLFAAVQEKSGRSLNDHS
jgi:hypothetical protein